MATWGPQVESYLELLHARNTFILEMEEETLKSKLLEKARKLMIQSIDIA